MRRYETVLFDFDGVLCHDRFYVGLEAHCREAHEFVQHQVFGRDSAIATRWMRGEISSADVNRLISERTGVDYDLLSRLFMESVIQMRVDARLIELAIRLRQGGVAVGLVTGNMDVFSQITVRRLALDRVFPAIVNSSDYGCLKHESDGRLFDIALALLGREGDFAHALLIDDSAQARATFSSRGGDVYPYSDYDSFRAWADANLILV